MTAFDELMKKIQENRKIIAENNAKIKTEEEKIKEIYSRISPLRNNVTQALDELDSYDSEKITVRFGDLKEQLIKLHSENGEKISIKTNSNIFQFSPDYKTPISYTVESMISSQNGDILNNGCSLATIVSKINEDNSETSLYSFFSILPNFHALQADGKPLLTKASVANEGCYSYLKFDNPDDIITNITYKTMKNVRSASNIDFFEAVRLSEYNNESEIEMK